MLRISVIYFTFFCSWSCVGQEKTPFDTYDFEADEVYLQKRSSLTKNANSVDEFEHVVQWAIQYKDFETAIVYYSKLIELKPDNAELYYRLGGVNGIRIDEISKFKALPYVHQMKTNFLKAHQLNPLHTPTLTALVQIYAKLPGFLGGSFEAAEQYAKLLFEISPIEGLLAYGFILESQDQPTEAGGKYLEAFERMSILEVCQASELKKYFDNKGRNLSYQIASIGLAFNLSAEKSICALEYYLGQFDVYDNLPKEWVYYKLALLYGKINAEEQANLYRSLAAKTNPDFKFK